MARIMKVRTIPRGYVGVDDLKGFVREKDGKKPSEWFMQLYAKFGNPQDDGLWSYLLRHNNVVIKITAMDSETMDFGVWLAPGFLQDARRRKTKVMNVIARRLNENKVVFLPEDSDLCLYYAVRKKNSELMAKKSMSIKSITAAMNKAMTEEEREAVYGGIGQYLGDAKKVIEETIDEIFDYGGNKV